MIRRSLSQALRSREATTRNNNGGILLCHDVLKRKSPFHYRHYCNSTSHHHYSSSWNNYRNKNNPHYYYNGRRNNVAAVLLTCRSDFHSSSIIAAQHNNDNGNGGNDNESSDSREYGIPSLMPRTTGNEDDRPFHTNDNTSQRTHPQQHFNNNNQRRNNEQHRYGTRNQGYNDGRRRPRRDQDHQYFHNRHQNNGDRHDGMPRHNRDNGRRRDNNNFNYSRNHHHRDHGGGGGGDDRASLFFHELEQRAKDHIRQFPTTTTNHHHPTSYSELIVPWHRTTHEIIMKLSKTYVRKDSSRSVDPMKIVDFVSLSHDMLMKVLMIRKEEIDRIVDEESRSGDGSSTSITTSESEEESSYGGARQIIDNDDATMTMPNRQQQHRQQQQRHPHRPHVERLTTEVLCQTVTLGWSRCDPTLAPQAARNAQQIIDVLEDICFRRDILSSNPKLNSKISFSREDVTPMTTKLQNHVLTAWSRSNDPHAEVRARKLLDTMVRSKGPFPKADTISYNNMLHLYAMRGNVDAACALLKEMEEKSKKKEEDDNNTNNNNRVTPDVYSYSILMNAYQKRFTSGGGGGGGGGGDRDMKDPLRAEEILSKLVTDYETSNFREHRLRPTRVTFSTVIAMYAQSEKLLREMEGTTRNWKMKQIMAMASSSSSNHSWMNNSSNSSSSSRHDHGKEAMGWGATNAERVLDWTIGLSERERHSRRAMDNPQNDYICPSARDFAGVMDAWAKAGRGVEGARRCERLLERLIALHEELGYVELRPTPLCFGTVIDAWAKADNRHESAEHAESLLDRMEELFLHSRNDSRSFRLSNIAYNLVMDAWSRRPGNAAERAERILRRLEHNYELTNNRLLRPDVISYTAVMKAYVDHPNGGEKALQILEEMHHQVRDGNRKARPDLKCISVAMDACAKNGLTAEAERLLNDIDDSKKSELLFNTVMSGYKREGRGESAEAALRRMIGLLEHGGWERCSPDRISYTTCIEAWGSSKSQERVSRAKALLDECIQRYQGGDSKCKPNDVIFNSVAQAISKGDVEGKETDILALFERMESVGCEPTLPSFNILIKTCSNATGSAERKRNALQIAASAYSSLPAAGLKADSITYTSMIHAMLNLIEKSTEEKVNGIAGIFRRCCDEGVLNQRILNLMATAMTEDELRSIAGVHSTDEPFKISSLPAEWSRNSSSLRTTDVE